MKQIDFMQEMIIDNFAGGGGASTGLELAFGRPVAPAQGLNSHSGVRWT